MYGESQRQARGQPAACDVGGGGRRVVQGRLARRSGVVRTAKPVKVSCAERAAAMAAAAAESGGTPRYSPDELGARTEAQLRRMCEDEGTIEDGDIGAAYSAPDRKQAFIDLLLGVQEDEDRDSPGNTVVPEAADRPDEDDGADADADGPPAVDPALEKYLTLKFKGNKSSVPRAGADNVGAESTMEELQEYRAYLLMQEGMPLPPEVAVQELPKFVVEQPAILRVGFELNSPKCSEALMIGEVIEVIEMATNPENSVLRLRCSRGWASERASDGTALLVPKLTEEEERALALKKEIELQTKLRAQLAANAAESEFEAAREAVARGLPMDAVAALKRAAKTDESRAAEAMEQILDTGNRAVRSGRLRDAVAVFKAGLETDPDNTAMQEGLEKAVEQLRQAELRRARDDYILEILNEQSSCMDPVTGRKALLSEMSCSLRVLAGMERAKLREKVDSREPGLLEDNSVYEQRALGGEQTDDAAEDTAEILLDEHSTDGKLHHAVVIGPPYSGRSSLLRQLAYMAAVAARDDRGHPVPVLIDLAELASQCSSQQDEEDVSIDALALLKSKVPAEQYDMLVDAFHRQGVLFLCDNMDRCGQFYKKIASYLVNTLATSARIVATSTFSRFKHQHLFARFGVVQLESLSLDAQRKTARARLSSSKHAGFEELLQSPAVALFAQSPLTLCLVVELFSSGKLASARSTSRDGLYEQSAQLMVERMARKCDDHVLAELGLTAAGGTGGKFWLFLESLAFLLHTNGTRDFEQEDVRELGAAEYQLWRTVVPVLGKCSAPILCQLPSTEVTDREEVQVKNGSMRGTWRFTHVAFQEYFFARALMKRLAGMKDLSPVKIAAEISDKLYNEWFREPLLIIACCAEDRLLSAIVSCVLSDADITGAREMLALRLLDERPEFAQESYRELAIDRRRKRVLATLTRALAHPCGAVRDNCMNDLRVVGLAPEAVAQYLVDAIRKSRRAQKWIQLTYLLHSVTAMRMKEADKALAEAVADLITPTSDLRVVCAAAKCLRRLRSSSDKITSVLETYVQSGHPSGLPEVTQTLGRLGTEWDAIVQQIDKRLVDISKGRSSGKATQREINQLYKDAIEALTGAGEHHADEVCGSLEKGLVHASGEVVCAAARALGSIGQSERVAAWVLGRITSRHPLPQKLAAITALRALAQGQIDGDPAQVSSEVIETFVAALREVSIEVRRAATNELKLVTPAVVDREISEALRDLVADSRLDVALRLDAAEHLTAVYVQALRLGGSSSDLTMEKVLERRRKHRQQASQEDLEAERRQRDADRHCRGAIEAAESLEDTLREMMEEGNANDASGGMSRISDWDVRRRAAHVLVEMAAAARKGTNSRLLTALLSWAREDVSRAEAFTLLGQLGSRRQRVREVLVDAVSDSTRAGNLEAAAALAQIYAGRGYKGELAVQEAVESALIEMLLRPPDEYGHREGEAMAVRSLVALYSPRVMHADDTTDDSQLIEVSFMKPGSLGISFGSRGLDVPPFITAIKASTEAAGYEELVYGE